jgi:hypothetical protein
MSQRTDDLRSILVLFFGAIQLALVTFAVESIISFSAKVHGQSVIGHGQSFATNSGFQRARGGGARTGHGLQTPTE